MASRLIPLFALSLCCGLAQAGIIINGNPPGLHTHQAVSAVQVRGWVTRLKLTDRHGRSVVVPLPRPYALDEALPLPPGDWADLTLLLDGPAWVGTPGVQPVRLDLPSLTVPLDDPQATAVTLDWTLPEGALTALRRGTAVPSLAEAVEEGGLARSAP